MQQENIIEQHILELKRKAEKTLSNNRVYYSVVLGVQGAICSA